MLKPAVGGGVGIFRQQRLGTGLAGHFVNAVRDQTAGLQQRAGRIGAGGGQFPIGRAARRRNGVAVGVAADRDAVGQAVDDLADRGEQTSWCRASARRCPAGTSGGRPGRPAGCAGLPASARPSPAGRDWRDRDCPASPGGSLRRHGRIRRPAASWRSELLSARSGWPVPDAPPWVVPVCQRFGRRGWARAGLFLHHRVGAAGMGAVLAHHLAAQHAARAATRSGRWIWGAK